MSSVYTAVGTFVTNMVDWMGDVIAFIIADPLLMIVCVAIPLVSLAVGFIRRLLRTRA